MAALFESDRPYSETDVKDVLERWQSSVGVGLEVDHVTLRRGLVDHRYLDRDASGSVYRMADPLPDLFEWGIHRVDPQLEIDRAGRDRAGRKARFSDHNG